MSINLSNDPQLSMQHLEENQMNMDLDSRCKGLYRFYWAMRARGLPTIELQGLPCHIMILRIEEWLNSTDFSQFEHLSLGHQGLTFIPEQISRFENLTWLNLSGNNLESLPNAMSTLTQLKHLDITENKFSQQPKVLTTLKMKYLFEDQYP